MKTISPITIWDNGTNKSATIFGLQCIFDNCSTIAKFYYTLSMADANPYGTLISSGNLLMEGTEYQNNWSTNDEAYTWAAGKLGLTITGNYVMPIEHKEYQAPTN
jgi:hypothetical protein